MTRRCSHCSNNGHNSRTCPNSVVKLFGVKIHGAGSIRKSASMGNLQHCAGGSPAAGDGGDEREKKDGYASEGEGGSGPSCRERKKGLAWTEEEHKMFLLGLRQLGKGDWRGISKKYVVSRTATQVASHAQKYFIRHHPGNKRRRRASLFDLVAPGNIDDTHTIPFCTKEEPLKEESSDPVIAPAPSLELQHETLNSNSINNPIPPPPPIDFTISESIPCYYPLMCSPYPPVFPYPYPCWPYYQANDAMARNINSSVVKPVAIHSTSPIDVDELLGMSKLSLVENAGETKNSPSMPLNLLGGSERHSAFRSKNSESMPLNLLGGSERQSAFSENSPSMPLNLLGGSERQPVFHSENSASIPLNMLGGSERLSAFHSESSPSIPLNMLGGSERHSAFHTNNSPHSGSPPINSSPNLIHAV